MYSAEKIKSIHRQLQLFFSFRTVLLGGSYLYGEARENSDLDFYVLDPFPWSIFFRRGHYARLLANFKREHETPNLRVLVVPSLFFNFGWYYIYGQTITKEIVISKVNKRIIFRTALKLAYFHYIYFLKSKDSSVRVQTLRKVVQQLAVARMMLLNQNLSQPIFSRKNLLDFIDQNPSERLLNELLSITTTPSQDTVASWGRGVGELLSNTAGQGGKLFSFSIVNYLIYNLRFLAKKSGKFIFTNPDAIILRELQKASSMKTVTEEQYKTFKEIIMPALIF